MFGCLVLRDLGTLYGSADLIPDELQLCPIIEKKIK